MTTRGQFEVNVISKVKHGALSKVLLQKGWNQKKAAEELGMDDTSFSQMMLLRRVPKFTVQQEEMLMEWTGQTIEQLFPPQIRAKEYQEQTKTIEMFYTVDLPPLLSAGEEVATFDNPRTACERAEVVDALHQVMNTLPDVEREALKLHYIDGLSLRQISKRLPRSPEAIRKAAERGLEKLRHPACLKIVKDACGYDRVGTVLDVECA